MSPTGIISRLFGLLVAVVLPLSVWAQGGHPQILGITKAWQSAQLSLVVGGRVEQVEVEEGAMLQRGDLILHLNRIRERLELKHQKLVLADRVRLNALAQRRKTLKAQVAQAKKLLASGAVSTKQVEDEVLALQAVEAELQSLVLEKKRQQVELEMARNSYEQRHLRAPFAGVVTKVLARVGESIAPNEAAVELVNVDRVRFVGTFPATQGKAMLQRGERVTLVLGVGNERIHREASVVFVSPLVDSASGLVEFAAAFDNGDGSIRPGLSGHVVRQEP
ncbi:efflux RND transporter periplasmic adaptor subunit [Magnetococcus sp. PR-3]|uniref:efflux RND transporter periplasmic adaptor subunit n=1 Tax=Magnetococcus sp. PR-3 TaxID=3120355 RepID=UPI002FCE4332